jgi:hypothetical protein
MAASDGEALVGPPQASLDAAHSVPDPGRMLR